MSEHMPSPFSARAAAQLQQLLLETDDIAEFLRELAALAAAVVPGDVFCGVTLRRNTDSITVASSDERAGKVDGIQYCNRQGPCLSSIERDEQIRVDDLVDDERWGDYRPAALAHGVRSSLSLPLRRGGDVIGAMNLYSTRPGNFGPQETETAVGFAAEAGRALALAVRLAERTEMSANLQRALLSRTTIDQAIGVVMAQNRTTAAEAFEVLRQASQNRNAKLRDVAADIVAAVAGPAPRLGCPAPPRRSLSRPHVAPAPRPRRGPDGRDRRR